MTAFFQFRCQECGTFKESRSNLPSRCSCGGLMRRDYNTFSVRKSFAPHFNHSVGKYVSNERDFHDELKRAGDKNETVYSPLAAGDIPGVTDEGMDETHKRSRDTGQVEPSKKLFT